MNEKLFRTQFNQMETTEKQALMESLAARYDMTFLGLHTFDRWGQNCTTGIFKKDGREFVFVPGDTVTLGWEQFAVGLNQESREELEYLFREWEMEPQNPEEMIRESMAPVRQAAIGPMLVGRELEELCWEPVKMDDPRLTAHPDWLKEFRDFAWSDSSSLTLHQSARIERTEKGFQICIYNRTDYDALLAGLELHWLLLVAVLISSLGAVMDVALSLASSLHELREADGKMSGLQLFAAGMRIGRDMIGTMSNTLILAFAGEAVTTLLLLMAYGWHSSQLFASDYAAIQVAQGVASTLGVVLGVPITSGICAALYRPLKR